MIGGKAVLPLQADNSGFLDLDGRGNENIIEPEPEEITPKPMISRRPGMIGIPVPEGIDQRFGIKRKSSGLGFQGPFPPQKTNGIIFFPGIEISRYNKGIGKVSVLNQPGQKYDAFSPGTAGKMIQVDVEAVKRLARIAVNEPGPGTGAGNDVPPTS